MKVVANSFLFFFLCVFFQSPAFAVKGIIQHHTYKCTKPDNSKTLGAFKIEGATCTRTSYTDENRWLKIAEDNSGTMYIDQATVSGNYQKMTFWSKVEYKLPFKTAGGEKASSELSRAQVDCVNNTFTLLEEKFFDYGHMEIVKARIGPTPSEVIAPSTLIEALAASICNK